MFPNQGPRVNKIMTPQAVARLDSGCLRLLNRSGSDLAQLCPDGLAVLWSFLVLEKTTLAEADVYVAQAIPIISRDSVKSRHCSRHSSNPLKVPRVLALGYAVFALPCQPFAILLPATSRMQTTILLLNLHRGSLRQALGKSDVLLCSCSLSQKFLGIPMFGIYSA